MKSFIESYITVVTFVWKLGHESASAFLTCFTTSWTRAGYVELSNKND